MQVRERQAFTALWPLAVVAVLVASLTLAGCCSDPGVHDGEGTGNSGTESKTPGQIDVPGCDGSSSAGGSSSDGAGGVDGDASGNNNTGDTAAGNVALIDPNLQLLAQVSKRSGEGLVCVVEYLGNAVTFLTAAGEELGTLNVGVNPAALAVTADKSQLYIANFGNGEVVRLTLGASPAIERVRVGTRPMALSLSEDETILYVADYYLNSIRLLDTRLMSLVGTLPLEAKGYEYRELAPACCVNPLDGTVLEGRRPVSLALSADGRTLYAGNIGTYDVSVLDTATGAESKFDGVIGTRDVVLSPDGKYLVIAGIGSDLIESNELIVRDAQTGEEISRIFIGKDVGGCAWVGDTLVAIAKETGEFCLIDPATWQVFSQMQLEPGIADVSLSADGAVAYVGNSDTGDVVCVDIARMEELWRVKSLADPRFILAF